MHIYIYFTNNIYGDYMDKNIEKIPSKDKVSLKYNLELERKDSKTIDEKGYDFVPRSVHALNLDEQKIKVREIEDKTK